MLQGFLKSLGVVYYAVTTSQQFCIIINYLQHLLVFTGFFVGKERKQLSPTVLSFWQLVKNRFIKSALAIKVLAVGGGIPNIGDIEERHLLC